MIHLPPLIDRIKALLAEGTDATVTYAALEARLALEKVCYDRLRQRHDYISHAQLRKWQPGAVVNKLMADVDQHVTVTRTLSISKNPAMPGVSPKEEKEWIEVGTEVGFDANQIAKMWQALANLALHVRLPRNKDDHIADYGDTAQIRAKVEEVIVELERLSKGSMTFSGIGEEVSFTCSCGEKNRRRAALLRDNQEIFCINPECKYTWKAHKEGDEFTFESVTFPVDCEKCDAENHMPHRFFFNMKPDEMGSFSCRECRHKNFVQWRLMQRRQAPIADRADRQPSQ